MSALQIEFPAAFLIIFMYKTVNNNNNQIIIINRFSRTPSLRQVDHLCDKHKTTHADARRQSPALPQ